MLACSALTACTLAPAEPPPTVIEAQIPVATPCIKEVPVRGRRYTDEEILAGSTYQAVQRLRAERLERDVYERKWEAIGKACIAPAVER
ncbi:hypothetical protein [Pandoraea commovens]|uniref:Lipoprotein n=1 Tax=Pandoraea commovens TaxID=2508289 RepID=A0ABY5QKX6_9BURK|nr:hypothetical protein [Pandoraea commovens]UVA80483.1 hypothetical protein NTU39_05520 [Pandoraea commovens]